MLVHVDPRSLRIDTKPLPETFYQHGVLDILNVVFYALVWIIIHALLQEYIWEVRGLVKSFYTAFYNCMCVFVFGPPQRTVKRLRLSKVKIAKYYDSGSLVVFYLVSLIWGINHIIKVKRVLVKMRVTCACTFKGNLATIEDGLFDSHRVTTCSVPLMTRYSANIGNELNLSGCNACRTQKKTRCSDIVPDQLQLF